MLSQIAAGARLYRRWSRCLAWVLYQRRDLDYGRVLQATSAAIREWQPR